MIIFKNDCWKTGTIIDDPFSSDYPGTYTQNDQQIIQAQSGSDTLPQTNNIEIDLEAAKSISGIAIINFEMGNNDKMSITGASDDGFVNKLFESGNLNFSTLKL